MIFNLFKSKPALKELIPEGFVDIHSHILPGIDDGAKSIEESLELITKMKEMGFSKIIATPHIFPGIYENDLTSIQEQHSKIKNKVKGLEITFAAEYMVDFSLINKIKEGKLLCLKENYILIEMSYISPPQNFYEIIFELRTNGYIPVLAHPERYSYFHKNFKEYYKLKKHGCLFQINLLSTVDYYGKDVRNTLDKLLLKGLVDFTGTDAHKINHLDSMDKKIKIKNITPMKEAINNNCLFKI